MEVKSDCRVNEEFALRRRASMTPPHWADELIRPWDADRFRRIEPFITSTYWSDSDSINVHLIVGTQHPDYRGKSWRWFLEGGKRMDLNLALHRDNPDYYLDTKRKRPAMHFVTLDGNNYYVGDDGNHRSCIAKFAFHYSGLSMLHGVVMTRHTVDWEFYRRYRALQRLVKSHGVAAIFTATSNHVGRRDTGGWKIDLYQPSILYTNLDSGKEETLDRGRAGALIESLRSAHDDSRRRWWNPRRKSP